jgi:hypothetical protein
MAKRIAPHPIHDSERRNTLRYSALLAALAQILDIQHRMAGAGDVEGRIIVGLRDGHDMLQGCGQDAIIPAPAFIPLGA